MKTSILIAASVTSVLSMPFASAQDRPAPAIPAISTLHAPQPIVADIHLAMMDDMMRMKDKKGGMGGMPSNSPMPNAGSASGMADPMAAPSNSDMMGRMRGSMQVRQGMGGMTPASQLPGFPGASHLYHVGAIGFFLDHPQHITLTMQQQTALNRVKEKALLDRATFDRRIEDAEQELWTLTAADAPDATKVEAQVRAIEKLRGDQRLAFIRSVGEAGKVLTTDQQGAVLGTRPPAGGKPPAAAKPAPMAPMQHK